MNFATGIVPSCFTKHEPFPKGHILEGANVFSTKPLSQIASDGREAVRKLMASKPVVDAFERINDILDGTQKPVKVQTTQTNKTMKLRNLTLAIIATIGSFHKKKLNFSAHDVSVSLREQVAAGTLDIIDVPKNFALNDGSYVSRIDHSLVRHIVRDTFEDGLIPDYSPRNEYRGGVTFVQYKRPDAVGEVERKTPTHAPKTFSQLFGLQSTPAPVATVVPAVSAPASTSSDSELAQRILIYVDRKLAGNEFPTLKRIQSRLKRTPATCDEIRNILSAKGYQIEPQSASAPSQDRVVSKY